ncbi:MAG: hypothetical protein RLZZ385_1648 [Pseudomonadota bacterium]|jgi:dihydroneopterin aldolase
MTQPMNQTDRVFIRGLTLDTLIGIHPHERTASQPVIVDLDMAVDIRVAAASDDIAHALDYDAVARRLEELASAAEFRLLEALAEAMAAVVQQEFAVPWLRLTLTKPGALGKAAGAGVSIERGSLPKRD